MAGQCIVLADSPGALVKLCGISTLERLLRTLQHCGYQQAFVSSNTPELIEQQLAAPSWARAELETIMRTRPAGLVTIEHIVDLWPNDNDLLIMSPQIQFSICGFCECSLRTMAQPRS